MVDSESSGGEQMNCAALRGYTSGLCSLLSTFELQKMLGYDVDMGQAQQYYWSMATEDDDSPETGDKENLSDISKMQTGDPY